jgi:hypothetical protein
MTIALYNSYDPNKFREPHRRVLARAGGLAMAFDMNLAVLGFPIPDGLGTPAEIAKWIAGTTSIGGHGDYFMQLAEKGRFNMFPYPSKGLSPQLGEPILTTSKPDERKKINTDETAAMVREGRSVVFIFGIGPRGVPKETASIPKYHLDVTGGGFSLETCTALGAVCGAVSSKLDQ